MMQEHLGLCLLAGETAVIPEALPLFPDVLAQLRITAAPAERATTCSMCWANRKST
jgi:hypothetical protein